MSTKQQEIHLCEWHQANYHIISSANTSSCRDDSTKCTNPRANQSGSQTTCAARRWGWFHKCLGRCLPTSLSPGKIGCGSARPWRSRSADRQACTLSHIYAHTHMHTGIVAEYGANIYNIILHYCGEHENRLFGASGLCAFLSSSLPFASNRGKTLTLMASQVGRFEEEIALH